MLKKAQITKKFNCQLIEDMWQPDVSSNTTYIAGMAVVSVYPSFHQYYTVVLLTASLATPDCYFHVANLGNKNISLIRSSTYKK